MGWTPGLLMATRQIHTAPPGTGEAILGKTLPDLMYDACARYTNPKLLNQPVEAVWKPYSLTAFREQAEDTALGLLGLGLQRGDRAAFYLDSDVYFCIADMGCLLAGLVDVPIYLTSAPDIIRYVIEHAEARVLVVSNVAYLRRLAEILAHTPSVAHVVVAEMAPETSLPGLPERIRVSSLDQVREEGRRRLQEHPEAVDGLRAQIRPHNLATIIYTSGTTGQPKGVMLTHENISYNALTSISGLTGFVPGPDHEMLVSFLPLTHVFARTLHYAFVEQGTPVYFTTSDDLVNALRQVRPTAFATVPRVLEKLYARILERTEQLTGLKRALGRWGIRLAEGFELGCEPRGLAGLKYRIADALVFKKWREVVGGRIRYLVCGGAALDAKLANFFGAAGIPVYQGYGLTETSPIITYNRPGRNRAGTVGEPLPGLEVMIAEDGEILTRGPHVMIGYYKDEEKTREVLTDDGWFHTGDIGEFTPEGYLRITDRKKDLFKLSTGKYVMPQPLETRLGVEGLVENAVVMGAGRKYCTALIFPEQEALRTLASSLGLDADQSTETLLAHPRIIAEYQQLVDRANEGMDPWSTIKRFALLADHLSIENGMLTPTLKVKRPKVRQAFEKEIQALYEEEPAVRTHDPAPMR